MDKVLKWVEENPVPSVLIGGVVVLGLLWMFGFFSATPAAASNTGQTNLAAAYYAAEAAQATAGTQLQLATVQATNQTAQVTAQANAAEAIAATQANMYTTLGGQSVTSNQTLYNDELLTAQTNANDAVQENQTNAYYNNLNTTANANATILSSAFNTIVPQALSQSGYFSGNIPGFGSLQVANTTATPNQLAAVGYTPAQIAAIYG